MSPNQANQATPIPVSMPLGQRGEKNERVTTSSGTSQTYASIVNEDEGEDLQYILCFEINGTKYAQIEVEDVQIEIEFLENAVVFCVVGSNPLVFGMEGYLKRVWANYGIKSIVDLHKGIFMVRFESAEHRNAFWKRHYFFDKKLVIVRAWSLDLKLDMNALQQVPIWVQFPHWK